MSDKKGLPSVMAEQLKRQTRLALLQVIAWFGLWLLVVAAGILALRYALPESQQVINNAGSPVLTEMPGELEPPPAAVVNPTSTLPPAVEAGDVLADTYTPTYLTYTVQEGDAFARIAERFNTDITTLMLLNPDVTPDVINVGDELRVPVPQDESALPEPTASGEQTFVEYTVVSGDTLAGIANYFGSTVDAIVFANSLTSPDQLQEGQTLIIPVQATPAASPTSEAAATPGP